MKKATLILILFLATFQEAFTQPLKSYQLYTSNGKKVQFTRLVYACLQSDIVLFGEQHNNAIAHWLQLELIKEIGLSNKMILGAEMIETDNQSQLSSYLKGNITHKVFDSTARLWPNYKTDYKPLVDYAKENKIPFIATNIPRQYARKVYSSGFETLDSLPSIEKNWIAPLPIPYDKNLPGYLGIMGIDDGGASKHANENLPKAQAVKDATMGYFISKNLQENTIFIHFNGCYHSDNFEGINWYLNQYSPKSSILTISTVIQTDISKLEKDNFNKADFILVVDEDVTPLPIRNLLGRLVYS